MAVADQPGAQRGLRVGFESRRGAHAAMSRADPGAREAAAEQGGIEAIGAPGAPGGAHGARHQIGLEHALGASSARSAAAKAA